MFLSLIGLILHKLQMRWSNVLLISTIGIVDILCLRRSGLINCLVQTTITCRPSLLQLLRANYIELCRASVSFVFAYIILVRYNNNNIIIFFKLPSVVKIPRAKRLF